MTDDELRHIRTVAARVRAALETCGPESGLPTLKDFPRESCADAVLLLGARLDDLGLGPFDAVGGEFSLGSHDRRSHAWLEGHGVIVDITADQFPDVCAPVLVTRDPSWRQRFHETNRGVADFRHYGPEASAELGIVYDCLVRMLEG
jgi:hypothetical protein